MRCVPTAAVWTACLFQVVAIGIVAAAPSPTASTEIVAQVDGEAIYRVEVQHGLAGVARKRPAADIRDHRLFATMLDQIVRRRLALRRLEDLQLAASKLETERGLAKKRAEFKQRATSLADFLTDTGIPLATYQRDLKWELSWAKYRANMVTDKALQAFFDSHRRDFDGTEVRVRHLLLPPPSPATGQRNPPQALPSHQDAVRRAEAIGRKIENGELTFAEAARQFSAAPSAKSGGDLGFFVRYGVMHEPVAGAAFRLRKGEISKPISSRFGVHLIEVTDERPGKLQWTDVRRDLRVALERALFEQLVAQQRATSRVERIWNADGDK